MTLDELAQVGLNAPAPSPDDLPGFHPMDAAAFEAGKKAATDHMIAAILRPGTVTTTPLAAALAVIPPGWTYVEVRSRQRRTQWVVQLERLTDNDPDDMDAVTVTGHGATPDAALAEALQKAAGGDD